MAARTLSTKFGSFVMDDATNGVTVTNWKNNLLRKTGFKDRQKGDGSIATADTMRGTEVELQGLITGVDQDAVTTNLDNFLGALQSGEDWLLLYDDRRLRCRLFGSVSYSMVVGSAGIVYRWSARFRSRWPWWEGTSVVSETFLSNTGVGPFNITLAASVGGEAPTWPVVKLTERGGGFTDKVITITNSTTLEQTQMIGLSLNDDQSIVIDMKEARIGDGLATAVTPLAIDGQWFSFAANATPAIQIAHNIGSGADLDVNVQYFAHYWVP